MSINKLSNKKKKSYLIIFNIDRYPRKMKINHLKLWSNKNITKLKMQLNEEF